MGPPRAVVVVLGLMGKPGIVGNGIDGSECPRSVHSELGFRVDTAAIPSRGACLRIDIEFYIVDASRTER